MKSIHYAGGELLTGDAIADAVVQYGEALARRETSAAVDIPVRFPDGRIEQASILLGPASQVIAIPERGDFEELVDDGLVDRLRRDARNLGDSKPAVDDDDKSGPIDFDDFDLA
ncbi:MAG: hypothetical protein JWL94_528 [Microbacteriaceae bacterium]|jgi:hypothetical protein|nr:hypothetical protein [Microbacteriaceae bacterium]HEV7956382.1 hypothetical protein [Marisediminicola sp.]